MVLLILATLAWQQGKPAAPADTSTLVRVAEQAKMPQLAMDSDGGVYIAFVRNGNFEVATSTDGGKTFGSPIVALDAHGRDVAIQNRGPRITLDRQKRIYVSAPLCLAPPSSPIIYDLFFAVSTDHGKSFGRAYQINDAPGSANEAIHWSAAGPGDLHVAWLDNRGGKGLSLLYSKFSEQGKRAGKIVQISPFSCERCPPALAVDGRGNPYVAWREGLRDPASKANRQIFLAWSTDGGRSFGSPSQLNSVDSGLEECPQEAPALAVTPDAKTLVASWMDRRDLEHDANVYWAYGPPGKFCRDTDVHDDRRFIQRRPSLAIDSEGTLWCAWEDGRLSTQRVFFTNTKNIANIPLGTAKEGSGSFPSLAAGGGRVAIAYQLGDAVGFRVLAGP